MTATAAPSGRPAWAVAAWVDEAWVYIELPCADAPPYIVKFNLSEGGLSKALTLMRDARKKAEPAPIASSTWKHPKLSTLPAKDKFTDEQRNAARVVLRKMGIL